LLAVCISASSRIFLSISCILGCAAWSISVCVTKLVLTGECVIVHHAAGGEWIRELAQQRNL